VEIGLLIIIGLIVIIIILFLLTRGDITLFFVVWGLILKVQLRRGQKNDQFHSFLRRHNISLPTHRIIDDADDETATGTRRNVLAVRELLSRYLEAVPAWTRIVEDALVFIPSHVLDFDLVVISTHVRLCGIKR
jgi:hypothetical protein